MGSQIDRSVHLFQGMKRRPFPRTACVFLVSLAVYFFYYVTLRSTYVKTASSNDVFRLEDLPNHGREAFEAKEIENYDEHETGNEEGLPETNVNEVWPRKTRLRFDFTSAGVNENQNVVLAPDVGERPIKKHAIDAYARQQFGDALVDIQREMLMSVEKLGDRWNLTK